MGWTRRILIAVTAPVVLVALMGSAWVLDVKMDNPRDEVEFIRGLDGGFRTNGHSTFAPVGDAFLIAEGDRACAWLRDQPYPWWRRGDRFSFYGLTAQYRRAHPVSKEVWSEGSLRPGHRSVVVGAAWNDLCGDAWELRQPHNPFNRPPSD